MPKRELETNWKSNLGIIVGVLFCYLMIKQIASSQDADPDYLFYFFTISFVLFKCGYFILYSFETIADTFVKSKTFNWFLLKFTVIFFMMILSFAVDYWVINDIDNESFKNVPESGWFDKAFEFFYFSFMTMTTVGYSVIEPMSKFSKVVCMIQVGISITLLAYVLSGFSSIRDALVKSNPLNINYKKERKKHKKKDK